MGRLVGAAVTVGLLAVSLVVGAVPAWASGSVSLQAASVTRAEEPTSADGMLRSGGDAIEARVTTVTITGSVSGVVAVRTKECAECRAVVQKVRVKAGKPVSVTVAGVHAYEARYVTGNSGVTTGWVQVG